MEPALGYGGEPGRPRRDGLEHGSHHLFPDCHVSYRVRIMIFHPEYGRRSEHEQDKRCYDRYLGMKCKAGKPPFSRHFIFIDLSAVAYDICPYRKSDTAQNDEQHRRYVDERICHIIHQAAAAEYVDTGIAECGYRMKD